MSGWFRRFRPSPPSAGLVPCPSTLRVSFPLPFQGLPVPGQVCWCVFAPSLFFCVPLFASWLSNVHLIFTLISSFIPRSSSSSSHFYAHHPAGGGVCVCLYRLNRRKTSITLYFYIYIYIYTRGITGVPGGSVINEDTSPGSV